MVGGVAADRDRRVRHRSPGVTSAARGAGRRQRRPVSTPAAVRVCIVYEHALFAHGVRGLLEKQKTLRMVGMIERPLLSLRELKRLKPNVVVVEGDGELAMLESLEGLIAVAISLRGAAATILTGSPIKVSGPEELARAIKAVAAPRRRGAPRVGP